MVSDAQRAANARNARRSSGPRTVGGKKRSSYNALRHGLLARSFLIPGEDPKEFIAFQKWVRRGMNPQSPRQELIAEQLGFEMWRQRRGWRFEAEGFRAAILRAKLDQKRATLRSIKTPPTHPTGVTPYEQSLDVAIVNLELKLKSFQTTATAAFEKDATGPKLLTTVMRYLAESNRTIQRLFSEFDRETERLEGPSVEADSNIASRLTRSAGKRRSNSRIRGSSGNQQKQSNSRPQQLADDHTADAGELVREGDAVAIVETPVTYPEAVTEVEESSRCAETVPQVGPAVLDEEVGMAGIEVSNVVVAPDFTVTSAVLSSDQETDPDTAAQSGNVDDQEGEENCFTPPLPKPHASDHGEEIAKGAASRESTTNKGSLSASTAVPKEPAGASSLGPTRSAPGSPPQNFANFRPQQNSLDSTGVVQRMIDEALRNRYP